MKTIVSFGGNHLPSEINGGSKAATWSLLVIVVRSDAVESVIHLRATIMLSNRHLLQQLPHSNDILQHLAMGTKEALTPEKSLTASSTL